MRQRWTNCWGSHCGVPWPLSDLLLHRGVHQRFLLLAPVPACLAPSHKRMPQNHHARAKRLRNDWWSHWWDPFSNGWTHLKLKPERTCWFIPAILATALQHPKAAKFQHLKLAMVGHSKRRSGASSLLCSTLLRDLGDVNRGLINP